MAKKASKQLVKEYTASNFSTLNAHADGVVSNEHELARLKRFRADRALIKNLGIIALIIGILAILLGYAYSRANAPVIEIVEKNVYIDKPVYEVIKVPDPELSEVIEVPVYIEKIVKVPIQVGAVTDEFSFFRHKAINKNGITFVTVGASYESVKSPYPESQWCYVSGSKVVSKNSFNRITLGEKSGKGAPEFNKISKKDATVFGSNLEALESAKSSCEWYPDRSPISDIGNAPPFESNPAPTDPPDGKGKSGTGFYINKDGYLLTNQHVVDSCDQIWINAGGSQIQARLIQQDEKLDIAALKVQKITRDYARFGKVRTGEDVMALGFPLGDILGTEIKATKGNVSSLSGFEGNKDYLQFTAPIQPGNSGGPLLNEGGFVVGINTANYGGERLQNINFAIKGTSASSFLGKHSIDFEYSDYDEPINSADLVELGEKYTVEVLCY
jgi:S1-C subfamily serine protease